MQGTTCAHRPSHNMILTQRYMRGVLDAVEDPPMCRQHKGLWASSSLVISEYYECQIRGAGRWWAHTSFNVGLPGQKGLQERQRGGLKGVALADQQPLQVRAQLTEQARQVLCPAGQRAQRHGLEQTSRTASMMQHMAMFCIDTDNVWVDDLLNHHATKQER